MPSIDHSSTTPPTRNFPPLAFGKHADESQGAMAEHYFEVGNVLVRWAKNRALWPISITEFENALHVTRVAAAGEDRWLYVPDVYKKISITQAGDGLIASPSLIAGVSVNTGALVSHEGSHTVTLQGSIPDAAEFMLRLPPASQVAESENRVAAGTPYILPPVYDGFGPEINLAAGDNDLSRFYARVADYTMRGCR